MSASRPVPVPDAVSAPYWAAAAEHVLTVARCARCGQASMPPEVVCPHCRSTDPQFTFAPVSGRGIIRSWTVVRQAFLPGFDADVPFVLVDVELDEQPGLRMIGRLRDGVDARLQLSAAVVGDFEDLAEGIAIPAFVLAP
ncbi:MAG TPA: OB-fold domain-containing protein [Mycobacterium sp.]|nr:OB-fold domain-containing protein [Mycobacterium sp.]